MAVTSKVVITYFLWIFASAAWAEDATLLNEQQENQVINLAYTNMLATIEKLNKKIDKCEKLERETILDPELLRPLPLTDQQFRMVLVYFRSLAEEKCHGAELWAKAFMEFSQFKYIEKYYKEKNLIKTEYNLEVICCIASQSRLESELKYREIPSKIRDALEKIPGLKKPFNLFDAIEKMGL